MSKMKKKYLEEYEKYKDVEIKPGRYRRKSNNVIMYEILEVDKNQEKVHLTTVHSDNNMTKTLHWCRKNLELI